MEKQEAILQHKIRSIDDKIYDLIQEKKQLQNELDSLGVIVATHDKELDITLIDSDINTWSEEKKVYFELVGKLNEPERSDALNGYNEAYFKTNLILDKVELNELSIIGALNYGINDLKMTENIAIALFKLSHNTYQFDRI